MKLDMYSEAADLAFQLKNMEVKTRIQNYDRLIVIDHSQAIFSLCLEN